MATVTLGETIRKYRRKKDITQEELAELLYLTPQAISRWETNATSPDAAILPKLAYIFGCTTDELLGVENFNQQEKFDAYRDKTYALGTEGKGEEVLALWRQALEEMPGNCHVMYEIATQLRFMVWHDSSDEAKKSWEEARDLYEYVLNHTTDPMLSHSVRTALPKVYDMLGEHEKAEKMADSLPSLGESREFVKQHIAATPKERINAQFSALNRWVELLDLALSFFSSNEESPLSEEERWEVLKKREALQELLYDGNIRETSLNLMLIVELAKGFARRGMWDEAMARLRKGVESSVWRDEVQYNEGYTHVIDALPFRYGGKHTVCVISTDPVIYRQKMAAYLSDAAFDELRKSEKYGPEFAKLTAKLV